MSLQDKLTSGFQRIGNEAKALRTLINGNKADLTSLNTTAKSSLVAAINELKLEINSLAGGGAAINDSSTSSGATWSSQKIMDQLDVLKSDILGPGVPAALDTLKEIADLLTENDGQIDSLMTALANRLRVDAAQSLTSEQQLQGRQNLGAVSQADIGDTSLNYVTVFETALAS